MNKIKLSTIIFLALLIAIPAGAFSDSLVITDIEVKLDEDVATISWRTNRASSSRVHYGETKDYDKFVTTNIPNATDHELTIRELKADTLYHFQVRSVDTFVNLAESNNFSFKTDKFEDDDTPIISNVKKPYITGSTATITWETDIKSTGKILYGNTDGYGRSARAKSYEDGTKHQVTIRRLKPQSIYHFRVEAKTRKGEPALYQDITFRTTSFINPEKTALLITKIEPADTKSTNITPEAVTIEWKTNKPSLGYVRYAKGTRPRTIVRESGLSTFNHKIKIFDLKPETDYVYRITSKDVFGKTISTEILSFTTPLFANTTKPVIVKGITIKKISTDITVIKTPTDARIYGIINGKKHHITSPNVLTSYGLSFADVRTVSQDTLNTYPIAKLVKTKESPVVFFMEEGRKLIKRIPSEIVFLSYPQNRWGDIITISHEDLQNYTETNLVKLNNSPVVYHINFVTGVRKRFTTEKSFLSRGYKFSAVMNVNSTELNSFTDIGILE
jgi:hypothetical protein